MASDPGFAAIPYALIDDTALTLEAKAVYMALLRFADYQTGRAFASTETLAERSGVGRTRVFQATAQLIAAGWLVKHGRGGFGRANEYTVIRSRCERIAAPFVQPVNGSRSECERMGPPFVQPVNAIRSPAERSFVQPVNANENPLTKTNNEKDPEDEEGVGDAVDNFAGTRREPPPTLPPVRVEHRGVGHVRAAVGDGDVPVREPDSVLRAAERQPRGGTRRPVGLTGDATGVVAYWADCFGRTKPPQLNPKQVAKLEKFVVAYGVDRLQESCEWAAEKGLTEFDKALNACRSKWERDHAPVPALNGHAYAPNGTSKSVLDSTQPGHDDPRWRRVPEGVILDD